MNLFIEEGKKRETNKKPLSLKSWTLFLQHCCSLADSNWIYFFYLIVYAECPWCTFEQISDPADSCWCMLINIGQRMLSAQTATRIRVSLWIIFLHDFHIYIFSALRCFRPGHSSPRTCLHAAFHSCFVTNLMKYCFCYNFCFIFF